METQLLRESEIYPSGEVLKNAMGNSYAVFEKLTETVTGEEYGLNIVWNYYKDGKAWLCKVCYKKKTIFWLSVWEKIFKVAFYFTEKTSQGVMELDIENNIKETFKQNKHIGRLIPLVINVDRLEQVKDVIKISEYKMLLK